MVDGHNHVTTVQNLDSCFKGEVGCWPLAIPLSLALRRPTPTTSCEHQQLAVKFAAWILDNGVEGSYLIENPALDAALGPARYCNGRSLLETEPEPQELSEVAIALGQCLAGIGIIWAAGNAVALVIARNMGELKSASVFFSLLAVGGVGLMMLGPLLLLNNSLSDIKCGFAEWFVVIGFSLTYGSLFAKLYRLYKIFTTRSLVVPRLGNRKLLFILLFLLFVDVVLLIVDSATNQRLRMSTFEASIPSAIDLVTGERIYQWSFCSFNLDDASIVILLVVKCVLIVLGAYMAFAIRQVDRRFSSTAALGWCFYNMFLTIIVMLVSTIFFSDVDHPQTSMYIVSFGLLWIFLVTLLSLTFDSNVVVAIPYVCKSLFQIAQLRKSATSQTPTANSKDSKDGHTPESSKRSNTSTIMVVNREMFPSQYTDFDAVFLDKILEELNYQRSAVREALMTIRGTTAPASMEDREREKSRPSIQASPRQHSKHDPHSIKLDILSASPNVSTLSDRTPSVITSSSVVDVPSANVSIPVSPTVSSDTPPSDSSSSGDSAASA